MNKLTCDSIVKKAFVIRSILDDVDCNNLLEPQWSFLRYRIENVPDVNKWWYLEVLVLYDNRYIVQRCTQDNGSNLYIRTRSEGVWTNWRKIQTT